MATKQDHKIDVQIPTDRIRERPRVEDASKTLEAFSLSTDGKRLAISSRRDLERAGKEGRRIIPVTDTSSGMRHARPPSPRTARMACITDETGEQEIALYDAGKDPHKILTKNKGWIFAPIWSPDGKQIAFADMTDTFTSSMPRAAT